MTMLTKALPINGIIARLRMYWTLTKSLQTGLLLVTGLAGYFSARCPTHSTALVLALAGSLFLAIAGSTVLNMVYDRDIDARMLRACHRPLPANQMSTREGLLLGFILSIIGVAWSFALAPLYGAVVFAGWFFDVVVYTMWLKRRTAWSIVWGGIAGAGSSYAVLREGVSPGGGHRGESRYTIHRSLVRSEERELDRRRSRAGRRCVRPDLIAAIPGSDDPIGCGLGDETHAGRRSVASQAPAYPLWPNAGPLKTAD